MSKESTRENFCKACTKGNYNEVVAFFGSEQQITEHPRTNLSKHFTIDALETLREEQLLLISRNTDEKLSQSRVLILSLLNFYIDHAYELDAGSIVKARERPDYSQHSNFQLSIGHIASDELPGQVNIIPTDSRSHRLDLLRVKHHHNSLRKPSHAETITASRKNRTCCCYL